MLHRTAVQKSMERTLSSWKRYKPYYIMTSILQNVKLEKKKTSGDSRVHKYFWLHLVKLHIKMSTLISKKSVVPFSLAIYSHFNI